MHLQHTLGKSQNQKKGPTEFVHTDEMANLVQTDGELRRDAENSARSERMTRLHIAVMDFQASVYHFYCLMLKKNIQKLLKNYNRIFVKEIHLFASCFGLKRNFHNLLK